MRFATSSGIRRTTICLKVGTPPRWYVDDCVGAPPHHATSSLVPANARRVSTLECSSPAHLWSLSHVLFFPAVTAWPKTSPSARRRLPPRSMDRVSTSFRLSDSASSGYLVSCEQELHHLALSYLGVDPRPPRMLRIGGDEDQARYGSEPLDRSNGPLPVQLWGGRSRYDHVLLLLFSRYSEGLFWVYRFRTDLIGADNRPLLFFVFFFFFLPGFLRVAAVCAPLPASAVLSGLLPASAPRERTIVLRYQSCLAAVWYG